MSLDLTYPDPVEEARRQIRICNACRYCQGYCAVFPALMRNRDFTDGDISQLSNLCHNCRGCYYACQYTAPHEFELNLPKALAEARAESWARHARPRALAELFRRRGGAIAAALVLGIALLWLAIAALPGGGEGFYARISHGALVAIFVPAFLLPIVLLALGVRDYWREIGGDPVRWAHLRDAGLDAGRMKNLSGGAAGGCNYEKGDRYSQARRHAHQAVLWGFLLCFASTSSGTVMHYLLGMEAPYGPVSMPKLLGVPGGILLTIGTAGLLWLRTKADPDLGAPSLASGDAAFVWLLGLTGASGLALYWAGGTGAAGALLALHLGAVLTFFLTLPFTKMAHAAYRFAALVRDAQLKS